LQLLQSQTESATTLFLFGSSTIAKSSTNCAKTSRKTTEKFVEKGDHMLHSIGVEPKSGRRAFEIFYGLTIDVQFCRRRLRAMKLVFTIEWGSPWSGFGGSFFV
jgi:hypothetical protein